MIDEYSVPFNKIQDLYTKLIANSMEIDSLDNKINEVEKTYDYDTLEILYRNEFKLLMAHIDIIDDLTNAIELEPVTNENQFELKRISKEINKIRRVEVMEL